ncbi:hypothetical protein MT994_16760 [Cellulosimicrobium sp. MI9406]|uniref:hypothetical protein n=1 Tax=Cellulosimicrobium sp. MI9406 TaxID=2931398 RepID=UPI0033A82B2B
MTRHLRSRTALTLLVLAAFCASCSAPPTPADTTSTGPTENAAGRPTASGRPTSAASDPSTAGADAGADDGIDALDVGPSPTSPPADEHEAETPPTETTNVVPTVSWAGVEDGAIVVNAFAPVVESGGTCTLELISGERRVEVRSPAVADAEVTWCDPLVAPLTELGVAGAWSVRVSYASTASSGSSAVMTVEVP